VKDNDYEKGMDLLLSALQGKIGNKQVLYNGLWNEYEGQIEEQYKFIKHANGVAIEYFGMHPNRVRSPFRKGIKPYIDIIQKTTKKKIFVFGRGSWGYTNYVDDYLWQRYLYCFYLLVKNENTLFKYHSSFQVPPHLGRSGGMDIYNDWRLCLGEAVDRYKKYESLYERSFKNGQVLVVPHDDKNQSFRLNKPMYTPEGELLEGEILVKAGQGIILLNHKPKILNNIKIDFEKKKELV
jgi:hypothetical protein